MNPDLTIHLPGGLAMTFHFHAAMRVEAEQYGDAVLTLRPERLVKSGPLPSIRGVPGLEPRGAIWAAISWTPTARWCE